MLNWSEKKGSVFCFIYSFWGNYLPFHSSSFYKELLIHLGDGNTINKLFIEYLLNKNPLYIIEKLFLIFIQYKFDGIYKPFDLFKYKFIVYNYCRVLDNVVLHKFER